eukprot:5833526-Amphidinium_carterae.3
MPGHKMLREVFGVDICVYSNTRTCVRKQRGSLPNYARCPLLAMLTRLNCSVWKPWVTYKSRTIIGHSLSCICHSPCVGNAHFFNVLHGCRSSTSGESAAAHNFAMLKQSLTDLSTDERFYSFGV